jgi:hypothetical protein
MSAHGPHGTAGQGRDRKEHGMTKFGPTRKELIFRLVFSLAGLGLMIAALRMHGIPQGPALFEVIGVAGLFFGVTAVWTTRKLIKGEHSNGL